MTDSVPRPGAVAHVPALDGLRGLAVLIVLASHFSSGGLLPQPGLHGVGKSGVYLFFVLSAFLLARNLLYRPSVSMRSRTLWLDYALRRVLRIWPLYLVVLLASWWATLRGWPGLYTIDTGALWRHLTLREGLSVLWSIPVEFTFYLWLPLLVLLLRFRRDRPGGLLRSCLLLAGVACAALLLWPPAQTPENDIRLGPYLVVFLCGVLAAVLDPWLQQHDGRQQRCWLGGLALLVGLAWCVAIPVVWCQLQGQPFVATTSRNWFLFFGLLWAALLLSVRHGPVWLGRLFAWAGLAWVGRISFSLYLWHMPVLWTLRSWRDGQPWPAGAALWAGAACLLVAWASYWLLERPLSRVRWPTLR